MPQGGRQGTHLPADGGIGDARRLPVRHVPATGGDVDVRGRIGVEECTEVGGARPLPPGRRAGHLDMLTQIVAEHGIDGQASRLLTPVAGVLVFALDEPRGETTARLARADEHKSDLQSLMRNQYDDCSLTTQNIIRTTYKT